MIKNPLYLFYLWKFWLEFCRNVSEDVFNENQSLVFS